MSGMFVIDNGYMYYRHTRLYVCIVGIPPYPTALLSPLRPWAREWKVWHFTFCGNTDEACTWTDLQVRGGGWWGRGEMVQRLGHVIGPTVVQFMPGGT